MHRQSLGSPSLKLHLHTHGGTKEETIIADEPKRRDSVSSSFHVDYCDDDDDDEAPKSYSQRLSSPPPKPEKFIHLIPILTFVCFFILYLCSHTPSPSDLAQFNGFKRSPNHLDSAAEISDIGQYTDAKRGDVLAIRSLRNLQEIRKQSRKSRPHRKLADF